MKINNQYGPEKRGFVEIKQPQDKKMLWVPHGFQRPCMFSNLFNAAVFCLLSEIEQERQSEERLKTWFKTRCVFDKHWQQTLAALSLPVATAHQGSKPNVETKALRPTKRA